MRKLQLYSLATPNGQKASIALEEMELDYVAHRVDILKGEQFSNPFIKINPNAKIPALVDPTGDEGHSLAIMESGAILLYLAEKTGRFLSPHPVQRNRTLQWLFFQVGSVGPVFGNFGHYYKYAHEKCDHPYPVTHYTQEVIRLLEVVDKQLKQNEFISGNHYSVADMALAPWICCLDQFYNAKETLSFDRFTHMNRWLEAVTSRPAYKKGAEVCN